MYVQKGGQLYGFCPAKSTWDVEVGLLYSLLVVIAETGQLPQAGGINDQPAWIIDELAWFLPSYSMLKYSKMAEMFLSGFSAK